MSKVTITIPDELKAKLWHEAFKRNISLAALIRELLIKQLTKELGKKETKDGQFKR